MSEELPPIFDDKGNEISIEQIKEMTKSAILRLLEKLVYRAANTYWDGEKWATTPKEKEQP